MCPVRSVTYVSGRSQLLSALIEIPAQFSACVAVFHRGNRNWSEELGALFFVLLFPDRARVRGVLAGTGRSVFVPETPLSRSSRPVGNPSSLLGRTKKPSGARESPDLRGIKLHGFSIPTFQAALDDLAGCGIQHAICWKREWKSQSNKHHSTAFLRALVDHLRQVYSVGGADDVIHHV